MAGGNRDRSRDRSRGRSRGKSRDKCGSEEARGGWEVGEWREVASMRTARTHHCCAAIDGLILAIGGTDGEKVLRTVECYDTARPEAGWVPVRPLAHPREGASAVVLGDSVYVIGGHDGHAHLCSVEVWSPKRREGAGHWRPASSLVQQRSALAAVSVGKALVALGGYCGRGGARMTSCEMWHPKDSDPRKVGHCSTLLLYSPNKKFHIIVSLCALRVSLCTACALQSLLWTSLQTLTPVTPPSSAETVSMELYQRHELPKVGPHCCRSTVSRAPSSSCVG